MGAYTEEQVRGIVAVVQRVADIVRAQPTLKAVRIGDGGTPQEFDLIMDDEDVGYCARLVRQCVEVGCGFAAYAWRYKGASALDTCANLKAAGYKLGSIADREPGCVVGINRNAAQYGHVAMLLGEVEGTEYIVENTSDHVRGNPARAGTKVTPWSAVAARVTGVYRLGRYVAEEVATPEPERVWQFAAERDGADIVARGVWATQFDDHQTRTGIPADDADVIGCSLPRGFCSDTKGSPFAAFGILDFAQVRVFCKATGRTIMAVVIDEGPAWKAQAGTGKAGSAAIDLSVGACKALGLADGQNPQVDLRVIGNSAATGHAAALEWAS